MTKHQHETPLLDLVEAFLRDTGMGPSYFGRAATGNSELVSRLRAGRQVLVSTDAAVRAFIAARRAAAAKAAE
jgi:hypothetical protein